MSGRVTGPNDGDRTRARLQASLRDAMKARDADAVSALKSVLSAIDNAAAVAGPTAYEVRLGVGAGDVARRELSEQDVMLILRAEIDERTVAANEYERVGQGDRAKTLRAEAAALLDYVDPDEAGR